MISVSDYITVVNVNDIYAICRFIDNNKVKEMVNEFTIETIYDIRKGKTTEISYRKVKDVYIDASWTRIYVKKFRIDDLSDTDRKYLENEFPAEVSKCKNVYLCIDPNILIDVYVILKLISNYGIERIVADVNSMELIKFTSDMMFYAPKDRLAPIIVKIQGEPRVFSIIAPLMYFR